MPKIRDSDSENNKDRSGDNTSATNCAFLIKFCLTISFTFLTSFSIKLYNLITRVSDVPTTSLISLNSRIKIPNSFSLSFCRFTKCVTINPVIVIINSAA